MPVARPPVDPLRLTDWRPLKSVFEYVLDSLKPGRFFAPADPSRELQRQILRLIDPDQIAFWRRWRGEDLRLHDWTSFEKDCVRWAKMCEVLDRPGETWDTAAEVASAELQGHACRGGPATIERAFKQTQAVLRALPTRLQRPRQPRGPNRLPA
jgi:hypothetical protein